MTKSTPQLCKDGFDIQDGSSRVVLLMTTLFVMLMKFSGQIQLGEEIMYSMFTVVLSLLSVFFRFFFIHPAPTDFYTSLFVGSVCCV